MEIQGGRDGSMVEHLPSRHWVLSSFIQEEGEEEIEEEEEEEEEKEEEKEEEEEEGYT